MMLNVTVTTQFMNHCAATAIAMALSRIEFGKISASITHTTGPHDREKPAMYTHTVISATSATEPALNRKPSAIMATAMMSAPRISSGLRPHLSTVTVAMSVNTTITMPMITVLANEAS